MLLLCVLCTVIISQLHLLRNLSSLYFVAYFGSFLLTIVVATIGLRNIDRATRYLLKVVSILYLIPCLATLPGLISGEAYSISSLGTGFGRLLFTLPIVMVVLLLPNTARNVRALLVTTGVLTVVASLSIPYQFISGPVYWFADSSERAGLIRFASLFGSITTLGIVCGMGIAVCAYSFRSATLISAALLSIALGSILSLSKTSFVNVAYAFIVLPFIRRMNRQEVFVFVGMLVLGFYLVYATFGTELLSFWSSFRLTDVGSSDLIDDVSLSESVLDRMTALPMIAVKFHGVYSLLLGVGPIGGAGTFSFADVPTVHNGLVELLLVGGVPMLLWYLWVNVRLATASIAMTKMPDGRRGGILSLFIFSSLFINTIFSSGMIFNPIGALFFAIALKLIAPAIILPRPNKKQPFTRFEGRESAQWVGDLGAVA